MMEFFQAGEEEEEKKAQRNLGSGGGCGVYINVLITHFQFSLLGITSGL